ncbi:hypothetical protein [Flavobacterium hiemivividum]|uniref:Uncharacterized protein n=1 Tax=Flavobacterium hiemivividum TaxID=2541734 RepID=A0A4R5CWB5_9FLAO|nr:hypothetical protein [Flavobacterium hiemivividum]TDE02103.1 hypothetical protein E0F98_13375 [Flavobacterium hiemivividum]
MKNSKHFMRPVLIVFIAVVFLSCKNDKAEKEDPAMTENDSVSDDFEPFKVILIKHEVADYNEWRSEYDAHDSIRRVHAISHFVIGREMDNDNMIIVIDKISDVNKAKEFSMLPDLKEKMKKAGVKGLAMFSYYDVIRNNDARINLRDRLMVIHRVKDFDAWLKVYDNEGMTKRMEEGLIDRAMARSIDDPNVVALVFAVSDMNKAKASITSAEKMKLMKEAGVEGKPELTFYKLTE